MYTYTHTYKNTHVQALGSQEMVISGICVLHKEGALSLSIYLSLSHTHDLSIYLSLSFLSLYWRVNRTFRDTRTQTR